MSIAQLPHLLHKRQPLKGIIAAGKTSTLKHYKKNAAALISQRSSINITHYLSTNPVNGQSPLTKEAKAAALASATSLLRESLYHKNAHDGGKHHQISRPTVSPPNLVLTEQESTQNM